MHSRKLPLSLILLLFISSFGFAQNPGDTIVVNVLNYQSQTRDTMAHFPTNPSISYEKVIMRYAMRCKNGLVSPPISGQTNIGCGEWDYSCNTYLTDSTRADSIARSTNRYSIYPDTNSSGVYSTTPTWYGTPLVQQLVNLQSIIMEDTATIGQGTIVDSSLIDASANGGKVYVLLSQAELLAAGLIAGDIDGFGFTNMGGSTELLNFKVQVKASTLTDLSIPDGADFGSMTEVFYHNFTAVSGANRIPFHTPFNWDGTSNLLLELSYKGKVGNGQIFLESHTTTGVQTISTSNDLAFNLFPNNYVEANNYLGESGNNSRTIEAWIKTGVANKEIVSWGTNRSGEKFTIRLHSNGRLRLEVNGGNIIGTATLNDNQWHHIAVTFNGTILYDVRMYVDGAWDFPSSVTTASVNTGQSLPVQISGGFHGRYWEGQIDDVRIWSTDLPLNTIADWRYKDIDASHPNYADLEMWYTADDGTTTITDQSVNGRDGEFERVPSYETMFGEDHFKNFELSNSRPNLSLYQGSYNLQVSNDTIIDTIYYRPYNVAESTVYPNNGTIYSDSIGVVNTSRWPEYSKLYDLNGNLVSQFASGNTVSISNSTLNYWNRNASKLEIMSFVTPYGINLDMGINGEAWYFDVSDFMPILNGDRRMTLERGGQWQEEMDISFLFIVGTPPRDVLDIREIWRVDQRSYTQIINDDYFQPVNVPIDTAAKAHKIRSVVTGHGQQGEFIPRSHYINVNGGPIEFSRTVWKECAENPVFPQGGTWIYDRAGWCPGMPTDVAEYDITSLVGSSNMVNLDYGVTTASGDSRYIVSNQLVSYGDPNFNTDGRIIDVISPTNHIEHGKLNPVCDGAQIVLQNSGSAPITSATLEYWVNNGPKESRTWNGTLNFLDQATIGLPTSSNFWSNASATANQFFARIVDINGQSDDYAYNDTIVSNFEIPDVLPAHFYIQFRTNNAPHENRYDIRDDAGNVIFQRLGMSANTTYIDTFNLSVGCYTFNVYDTDDDGLDFFGNNDGTGSINLGQVGVVGTTAFEPDFGDGFSYDFTISFPLEVNEVEMGQSVSLYPNPVKEQLQVETTGLKAETWEIYNAQGRLVRRGSHNESEHFNRFVIDVADLSSGIYFLRFNGADAALTKRFIVE